jgi:hypothetical protein
MNSGSCDHLKCNHLAKVTKQTSLTEFPITINKLYYMSGKVVFLCVANKNCQLKGVAAKKRLRTTDLGAKTDCSQSRGCSLKLEQYSGRM